jgi:hypothetical protein
MSYGQGLVELQVEVCRTIEHLADVALEAADFDPPWLDALDGCQDDVVFGAVSCQFQGTVVGIGLGYIFCNYAKQPDSGTLMRSLVVRKKPPRKCANLGGTSDGLAPRRTSYSKLCSFLLFDSPPIAVGEEFIR